MDDYLTTREASRFLGVTSSRIRQLILEGRIISNKIGRDHLIDISELQKFAKNGRKKRGRRPKN